MTGCARCDVPEAPILTYFGPALCRPCAQHGADYYDRIGRWPPPPPDWQDALDELVQSRGGHLAVTVFPAEPRPPVSAASPALCPPEVQETETHLWMTCDQCGQGAVIARRTVAGQSRKPPRCYLTPGCDGRYRTTPTTADGTAA